MSDTSQGPGWWMASNGRWYPPESHPNAASPRPPKPPQRRFAVGGFVPLNSVLAGWSQGIVLIAALMQAIQSILAYQYWRALESWYHGRRREHPELEAFFDAENRFLTIHKYNAVIWLIAFILLLVWIARVHDSTTSLLPRGDFRKFSRAWNIGIWFIPLVNLVGGPIMLAESQRIAMTPRKRNRVDKSWRSTRTQSFLVWWWLLVIGGQVTTQVGRSMVSDSTAPVQEFFNGITAEIIGSMLATVGLLAGAAFITIMNQQLTVRPAEG